MSRVVRCQLALAGALAVWLLPLVWVVSVEARAEATAAAAELTEPLTREAVRELVARLSDSEVRQLLVTHLDRTAVPPDARREPAGASGLARDADRLRGRLQSMLRAAPSVGRELGAGVRRFSEGGRHGQLPLVGVVLVFMLAVGLAAEWFVGRLLRDVRGRLVEGGAPTFGTQAARVTLRLVVDLLLLGVFTVTAVAIFLLVYQGHEPSRELAVAALIAALQVRLVIIVARLLLAPQAPAQRLLPFGDAAARGLFGGVVSLAVLFGLADLLRGFMDRWAIAPDVHLVVMTVARLLFVAVLLWIVWRHRAPIAALIRGPAPGPLRRLLADLWPVLATVYVTVLLFAVTVEQLAGRSLGSRAGIASLLVVVLLPLVDMVACRLITRRHAPPGLPAPGAAPATFAPVLHQTVHIVVTVAGLLLIARLWHVDLFTLAARGVGAQVAGALINLAVTLLLAHLVWQLARTAIDRRLARETGSVGAAGEAGGTGSSRLRTLLPLARVGVFVTISVMAAMTVLAGLGVNIGPLLAGAGVLGLAVGFGGQALVRDIISGAFYLMDDAFRLGEYVDVGDAKGTVEKIGVRSMQLRHHRGALNIVPYGAIRRLRNDSRDWVVEKLQFRVTYDTDIAKVKKILKRIGQELQDHPEIGPNMLEPLKSQGVVAMEDSAMLVTAKFMAKPGEQFVIRREAYQRVKQAFDEAGIRFAHRQVTVLVPPGAGSAAVEAAGAAAMAATAADATAEAPR